MSMTEVPEAPKPKRKYTRRKPMKARADLPAPTAPVKPAQEFAGLTITDCCKACSPAGCVISGKSYCGHPRKGAQINMNDSAAVERLNRAKKFLGTKAMELRYAV